MTPHEFLKLLWQNKPEGHFVLLWTLPESGRSGSAISCAAANIVESVERQGRVRGRRASKQDHGPAHRCVSDEIAGHHRHVGRPGPPVGGAHHQGAAGDHSGRALHYSGVDAADSS